MASITILGSSGTYASADNPCSGYLLRSGGCSVLVDCGPGTMGALQRHVGLADLDAVVVSHSHPDHWLELPVMRNALKYVLKAGPTPFYSTSETIHLANLLSHDALAPTFEPHEVTDGSSITIGPFTLRFSRTDHPPETLAVRADSDGTSIAYSADTGPGWGFSELGPGIDLAICEATVLDAQKASVSGHHMTAAEAGTTGRESAVDRLVLTHLLPGSDPSAHAAEAEAAYGSPVSIATPGAVFE